MYLFILSKRKLSIDLLHFYLGLLGEILLNSMALKQGYSFPCSGVIKAEYGSGRLKAA